MLREDTDSILPYISMCDDKKPHGHNIMLAIRKCRDTHKNYGKKKKKGKKAHSNIREKVGLKWPE